MHDPRDDEDSADKSFSSPACALREVTDVYGGYAATEELAAFLNELLEAERAGARVTIETARMANDMPTAVLIQKIHRDEARWCAMLIAQLTALGVEPSDQTGAFYGKAMAIAPLDDRLRFLNRGQGWVVNRLRGMLPRVRDNRLHGQLRDMLDSHVANIALTDAYLP